MSVHCVSGWHHGCHSCDVKCDGVGVHSVDVWHHACSLWQCVTSRVFTVSVGDIMAVTAVMVVHCVRFGGRTLRRRSSLRRRWRMKRSSWTSWRRRWRSTATPNVTRGKCIPTPQSVLVEVQRNRGRFNGFADMTAFKNRARVRAATKIFTINIVSTALVKGPRGPSQGWRIYELSFFFTLQLFFSRMQF